MSSLNFYCVIFFYVLVIQEKSFVVSASEYDNSTESDVPTYECYKSFFSGNCVLKNVQQTSSKKKFKVISNQDVSGIANVWIKYGSTMDVLTEDICDALPHLKLLDASFLHLTSVDENAFKKCAELVVLDLHNNSLTSLPSGLFDSNIKLGFVWLQYNELTNIDGNLFKNNPNLVRIALHHNKLQKFSFSAEMPVMTKLQLIHLDGNELSDIDIETLLEKSPNLTYLNLDSSKFPCDRHEQIIKRASEKNDLKFRISSSCIESRLSPETTD